MENEMTDEQYLTLPEEMRRAVETMGTLDALWASIVRARVRQNELTNDEDREEMVTYIKDLKDLMKRLQLELFATYREVWQPATNPFVRRSDKK